MIKDPMCVNAFSKISSEWSFERDRLIRASDNLMRDSDDLQGCGCTSSETESAIAAAATAMEHNEERE